MAYPPQVAPPKRWRHALQPQVVARRRPRRLNASPGRIASRGDDRGEHGAPSLAPRFIGIGGEALERDQQADDLLLPDLAGTADAVMRQTGKLSQRSEFRRRAPQFREYVQVQHLQQCRTDQVGASAQDARRLRSSDRLAAAECDKVGALLQEAPKIRRRRQLCGSIDHQRDTMFARDRGDILQRRLRLRMREIVDARCVFRDRLGDFPRRGIAHARAAVSVGNADLDEFAAGHQQGTVVHVALAAHDDEFVAAIRDVRQTVHARGIEAGKTRRRRQQYTG